jgi:nitroreductase
MEDNMIKELVYANRSYRRFAQNEPVGEQTLKELVDLARVSASARNLQPLKYMLSCDPQRNAHVFATLSWAGYLGGWKPEDGERPAAYIVVLGDKELTQNFSIDPGIAAQSILLGAVEQGLGGCMLTSIKKQELAQALNIPERYDILLVIGLGRPVEQIAIEPVGADGNIKYWRDADRVHHLPKRALDDIIVN